MEWFQLVARMLAPSAQHPIGSSGDIYPTVTVYLDESLIATNGVPGDRSVRIRLFTCGQIGYCA
jgi:hypothetical protein